MNEETEIENGTALIVEEINVDPIANPIAEAIGAAPERVDLCARAPGETGRATRPASGLHHRAAGCG